MRPKRAHMTQQATMAYNSRAIVGNCNDTVLAFYYSFMDQNVEFGDIETQNRKTTS